MKKVKRLVLILVLSISGACLLLVAVSAASNAALPQHSPVVETLSEGDKIRLSELQHARQTLGDAVWPGWGAAEIPAIAYNEEYVFLTGYPETPSAGWLKMPAEVRRGGTWEATPGDDWNGQVYYRQRLADPNVTPEAFTVRVGERWVSSLPAQDWARIRLTDQIRGDLPAFLQPVFPYRLMVGQLLGGSDKYISLMAHEAFHAYQGALVPQRLAAAENASDQYANLYPWDDEALQADWQVELDTLAKALRAGDGDDAATLARQFLARREARRAAAQLSDGLAGYERQREWLEGLARYAELEIWRLAAQPGYTPLPETQRLDDFDGYRGFETRWRQEIGQIGRMADDEGDGRFYYSGMAQAYLLEQFMPGWKARAFQEGVWLEDLLAEALAGR